MSYDIGKIGTVTEKSFTKPEQFDPSKQGKELQAKDKADAFSDLVEKGEALNPEKNALNNNATGASKPTNAGDRILNAFQGMKENIDTQRQGVDKLLSSSEALSMRDMIKTQHAMNNLTLTQDLIGKVVGKSTQTIETMMKQQ